MPNNETHKKICELFLGDSYGAVDTVIDWPVRYMGKSHRELNHSLLEATLIGLLVTGEVKGGAAGALHVMTDQAVSFLKEELKKSKEVKKRNGNKNKKK